MTDIEQRIAAMTGVEARECLLELAQDANTTVGRWASGDLAGAVSDMAGTLDVWGLLKSDTDEEYE